jgi:hypothetical protein
MQDSDGDPLAAHRVVEQFLHSVPAIDDPELEGVRLALFVEDVFGVQVSDEDMLPELVHRSVAQLRTADRSATAV